MHKNIPTIVNNLLLILGGFFLGTYATAEKFGHSIEPERWIVTCGILIFFLLKFGKNN
jgi:hypothetical protein